MKTLTITFTTAELFGIEAHVTMSARGGINQESKDGLRKIRKALNEHLEQEKNENTTQPIRPSHEGFTHDD